MARSDGLFDYLDWRGDLSFIAAPFNEVDSLILCELCYAELSGCVPGEDGRFVPLKKAAELCFGGNKKVSDKLGVLVPDTIIPLFRRMSETVRFADIMLGGYVNRIREDTGEQFSALTVGLPDNRRYVAFRGTDDTIVGWKENFRMGCCEAVPAQLDAAAYLDSSGTSGGFDGGLLVGGHSKGGNLAMFAAMRASDSVFKRIERVWNFDGPGFEGDILNDAGFTRISPKLVTILPRSSVVGLLLHNEDDYQVVQSDAVGLFQHDGFSWEVRGASFRRVDSISDISRLTDETLKAWIKELSPEERRGFVDALFDLLESTGAKTLTELNSNKLRSASAILGTMRSMDPAQREMLSLAVASLVKESLRVPAADAARLIPPALRDIQLPLLLPASSKQVSGAGQEENRRHDEKR